MAYAWHSHYHCNAFVGFVRAHFLANVSFIQFCLLSFTDYKEPDLFMSGSNRGRLAEAFGEPILPFNVCSLFFAITESS